MSSNQRVPPGRKARREGVKAIVARLHFCINSRPPLNFEAAEICYEIWLTATFVSYPLFIALLGWNKVRLSKLTSVGRNRTLMKHQDFAPNKLATLYELSHIDEERLEKLFRRKLITPQITAKEARALKKR